MADTQVSDIAFSPTVKAAQEKRGSRGAYARMEEKGAWSGTITEDLAAFIAERDSFYFATSNAEGQPYIQHRGGPKGFLKVLDDKRLAIADFAGNQQYISLGNLEDNPKAFIFLMDYVNRRRIKIWGRAEFVENDEALLASLADPSYSANPERALVFTVDVWDRNCPQHIQPRFTEDDLTPVIAELKQRIESLEAENRELRSA